MINKSFPFITFTNVSGKEFCIHRDRILHCETYEYKDDDGQMIPDPDKTFVNFASPNPKSKGTLHAVVDMSLSAFRQYVLLPAWERQKVTTYEENP